MAYSKEQAQFFTEKVRMIMILRGSNISCREIVELLAKNKIEIGSSYANKLKNKILAERTWRTRSRTYNDVLPELEDELEESARRLWSIAVAESSSNDEKIRAMREIMDLKFKFLDVLMISGKISKEPVKLEVSQKNGDKEELPKEVLAAIECIEMQMRGGPPGVRYTDDPIEERENQKKESETKVEPKGESDPNMPGVDLEEKNVFEMPGGTLICPKDLP